MNSANYTKKEEQHLQLGRHLATEHKYEKLGVVYLIDNRDK